MMPARGRVRAADRLNFGFGLGTGPETDGWPSLGCAGLNGLVACWAGGGPR